MEGVIRVLCLSFGENVDRQAGGGYLGYLQCEEWRDGMTELKVFVQSCRAWKGRTAEGNGRRSTNDCLKRERLYE